MGERNLWLTRISSAVYRREEKCYWLLAADQCTGAVFVSVNLCDAKHVREYNLSSPRLNSDIPLAHRIGARGVVVVRGGAKLDANRVVCKGDKHPSYPPKHRG